MKNLYIIAGPNGAGKTTASFTVLPEILNCQEFVNADEIAQGLSPLNQNGVSVQLQSGRLMLRRIHELLEKGINFALETTLSTRSYIKFIKLAQSKGYLVTLLFLHLDSSELAIKRVEIRVKEGGHSIPENVIIRRYQSGLKNFFQLFNNVVNKWVLVNNTHGSMDVIAEKNDDSVSVVDHEVWCKLKKEYDE
ncbi:MAG: zeta toxin family protein [Flavobacteriales bacterium]|jgi:predicted ABC-type ATPase|nr:zeta toxin family protein [Flavobacteriales bacterium]